MLAAFDIRAIFPGQVGLGTAPPGRQTPLH